MVRARTQRYAVPRWLVVAWLAVALGALLPADAYAAWAVPVHAELRSVTPANGATLAGPPTELVLVFNEDVNPAFVQVSLTRAGAPVALAAPTVTHGTVTMPVPSGAEVGAGAYRIAYRVVSTDGHPVSGASEFTVTGAAAAATSPTAAPSSTAPGSPAPTAAVAPSESVSAVAANAPTGTSSGMPGWAVAALVVVVAGAIALLWYRRRRGFPPSSAAV